jgi:hypothetical protein
MKTVFTIAAPTTVLVAHPILLLLVPAGIILCGAATGIAQALRIGLCTHLLRLMGIETNRGLRQRSQSVNLRPCRDTLGSLRRMPGIQYHVQYANGEGESAESLDEARTLVMQRTGHDQAPPGLLPARIFEVGPNDVGSGRLVDEISE